MALKYIFDEVASKIGLTNPELNPEQATWLKRKINIAANRLYRNKDLPFQLSEIFVRITNEQTLILPGFVGEVRAMRSQRWDDLWTLNDIRPRYSQKDWPNKWNKVRIVGEVPIAVELTNSGVFSYEYPVADNTIIVTTVGETALSNREIDNITLAATTNVGLRSFTQVNFLRKNKPTNYNVTVKDITGAIIAHIYADQLDAKYFVFDISAYPRISDCTDGSFVMEVLYKPMLPRLENDEDSFPLLGYDDVLVKMTMQVISEDEEGKEARAVLMNEQSKELVRDIVEDKVGTTQKPMFVEEHPLYDLFPKYGERC